MSYWYIIDFVVDGPFDAFEIAGPVATSEDFDNYNGQMGHDIGVFEAESKEEALKLAYDYDEGEQSVTH